MRTEWQEPDDRTACPKRVPAMHDWRKSMPYTGPDGRRVMLWLCSACLSPSLRFGPRPTTDLEQIEDGNGS